MAKSVTMGPVVLGREGWVSFVEALCVLCASAVKKINRRDAEGAEINLSNYLCRYVYQAGFS
jgi:hypothetical protein